MTRQAMINELSDLVTQGIFDSDVAAEQAAELRESVECFKCSALNTLETMYCMNCLTHL